MNDEKDNKPKKRSHRRTWRLILFSDASENRSVEGFRRNFFALFIALSIAFLAYYFGIRNPELTKRIIDVFFNR